MVMTDTPRSLAMSLILTLMNVGPSGAPWVNVESCRNRAAASRLVQVRRDAPGETAAASHSLSACPAPSGQGERQYTRAVRVFDDFIETLSV
jgi:hypothetical protein